MKRRYLVLGLLLLVTMMLGPTRLSAQATGTIVGTVTDPSGAVVPNATIKATNDATGVSRSTITGQGGTYTIPSLPTGSYTVTAVATGFETAKLTGITLDVNQARQVDFPLSLSGTGTKVEVKAAPPLLDTTDGMLGGVVTGSQVQSLPLNGRDISNLVMLEPGMAQDSSETAWIAPQWVSNGSRPEALGGTLDGMSISDTEFGLVGFWNFNLDAIDEFKLLQNNYSAQYGEGAGSIVQMVSKAGTNQFHGSLFEFVRNSSFDARNFFATSVPPFNRNEFGGTFGGPIKKDKTFFFVEYAGLRQRLGEPTIVPVPTQDNRNGLVNLNGDELQVPLNSVAQTIMSLYPLPNQPNGIYGPNTLNIMFKAPTNDDQWSARLDHHISAKDSLFARASYINNLQRATDPVAAVENLKFSANNTYNPRNYVVGETHVFSPTLVNVFSVGLNRNIMNSVPPYQGYPQTVFEDGSLAAWGPDSYISLYTLSNFVYQDHLTWIHGRHTFDFGFNLLRSWDNAAGAGAYGPNGEYEFNAGTTLTQTISSVNGGASYPAGTGSPNGMISFMEGLPVAYGRSSTLAGFGPPGGGFTWFGLRTWHLGTWIQDDIKMSRRLTLNLGLRYEHKSVPYEVGDRFGDIVDNSTFGGGSLFGDFILHPSPLYKPDYPNFAPRLGFAYRVNDTTVVRGGFATFTNTIPTMYPDQDGLHFPVAAESTISNPTYYLTPQNVSQVVLTSLSGQVMPPSGNAKLIPPNTPVSLASFAAVMGNVTGAYNSDSMRNGYTINGNFTVEKELPGSVNLSASYVATNAVALYNELSPNAYTGAEPQYTPYSIITPGLGMFELFYNGGHSTYNSLQLEGRKISARHGLQFQVSYTWSKFITNADDIFNGNNFAGMSQNNPFCLRCEKALSADNVPQRIVANFSYNLPIATAFSHAPKRLTQGWQVLGIVSGQSGLPFTVLSPYGTVQYGDDTRRGIETRPFLIQQPTYNQQGGPQYFSDAVIADQGMNGQFFGVPTITNATGTWQTLPGNLGRDTFHAPHFSNADVSIIKDTKITETKTLQFRAEFFNLFNQHAFTFTGANIDGVETSAASSGYILSSPGFGISSATATAERQIQFALRLIF